MSEENICHFSEGSLHVCPELNQFLPKLSRNPVGFSLKEVLDGGTLRVVGVTFTPRVLMLGMILSIARFVVKN